MRRDNMSGDYEKYLNKVNNDSKNVTCKESHNDLILKRLYDMKSNNNFEELDDVIDDFIVKLSQTSGIVI